MPTCIFSARMFEGVAGIFLQEPYADQYTHHICAFGQEEELLARLGLSALSHGVCIKPARRVFALVVAIAKRFGSLGFHLVSRCFSLANRMSENKPNGIVGVMPNHCIRLGESNLCEWPNSLHRRWFLGACLGPSAPSAPSAHAWDPRHPRRARRARRMPGVLGTLGALGVLGACRGCLAPSARSAPSALSAHARVPRRTRRPRRARRMPSALSAHGTHLASPLDASDLNEGLWCPGCLVTFSRRCPQSVRSMPSCPPEVGIFRAFLKTALFRAFWNGDWFSVMEFVFGEKIAFLSVPWCPLGVYFCQVYPFSCHARAIFDGEGMLGALGACLGSYALSAHAWGPRRMPSALSAHALGACLGSSAPSARSAHSWGPRRARRMPDCLSVCES